MIDKDAVSEKELHPEEWKHQTLLASIKNFDGKLWIDARKWIIYDGYAVKTKRGLMLELKHWRAFLPILTELLNENE